MPYTEKVPLKLIGFILKLNLLLLASGLFLLPLITEADSVPSISPPAFKQMLKATSTMGWYYEMALTCGLPDSETQGIARSHAANKALLSSYQSLVSVSDKLKKTAGSAIKLQGVFDAGRRQRQQLGVPTTAECSQLKGSWPRFDRSYLQLAQTTYTKISIMQAADRERVLAQTPR